jgi:hypothetical protein
VGEVGQKLNPIGKHTVDNEALPPLQYNNKKLHVNLTEG